MPSFIETLGVNESIDIQEESGVVISCHNDGTAEIVIDFEDDTQEHLSVSSESTATKIPPPVIDRITNHGPNEVEVTINIPDAMDVDDSE